MVYWLLAIGYWLLAIGYWLLAIKSIFFQFKIQHLAFNFLISLFVGYWLLALGSWLLALKSIFFIYNLAFNIYNFKLFIFYTYIFWLRKESQGFHATFATNARVFHSAERRTQITQKPRVYPNDSRFKLFGHVHGTI